MKTFTLIALIVTVTPLPSLAAALVSSDSSCPSSDAISLRLLGLLAEGGPESATARVRVEGESMRIELSTPGEESRQRTVPATGDCDSLAEKAAFIIAAWLDAMPVGSFSTPGVPPREVQHKTTAAGQADPLDASEAERPALSTRTLLSGGIFGLGDGLGASAGLATMIGMPNLIERVGWLLEASMSLSRQITVGQGTAHMWRPTFALLATLELYRKRWLLRAQVGPVLGILLVNGSGNYANASDTSAVWGGDLGLSLVRPWKRHEVWLRLDTLGWPQGRSILSQQAPSGANVIVPLPGWEVRSVAGFSLGIP